MPLLYSLIPPKLKNRLKRISVCYEPKQITLRMSFYSTLDPLEIKYREDGSNALVMCKTKTLRATIPNIDFVSVFCEDLEAILSHRNSRLQELKIGFMSSDEILYSIGDRIFECIEKQLHVSGKLKVKTLTLDITSIDQVLGVMPHLDPKVLEKVDLTLRDESVEIQDVLEVEDWKCFEDLEMEFTMEELGMEGMVAVKETLLSSPTFKAIELHYDQINDDEALDEILGAPLEPNNESAKIQRSIQLQDLIITVSQMDYSMKVTRKSLPRIPEPPPVYNPAQTPDEYQLSQVFENPSILMNTLKYADGIDIQCLRKVSHTIRDTIDFLNPDPKLDHVSLESNGFGQVSVTYNAKNVTYEDCPPTDCIVGNHFIPAESHLYLFLMDFQSILKYQRHAFKGFNFNFRNDLEFFEMFSDYLKSRLELLRIENLQMRIVRQSEAMAILPYVEPITLRSIELLSPSVRNRQTLLDIDELVQLEQWRMAREIKIHNFVISTSIRHIFIDNLDKADICLDVISTDDLHYLKEKFLNSTANLLRFKISFKEFSNNNNESNEPLDVIDLERSNTSYYRIPNNTDRLLMLYSFSNCFIFSHEGLMSIPDNAVFRG